MAVFAVFHGHAHGTELPEGQSGMLYSIGFVVATGCLHALGIAIGLVRRWPAGRTAIRPAGAAIAVAGVSFVGEGGRVKHLRLTALGALGLALLPSRAEAHLGTTGLGPMYDGNSHLLLSPDDLVPVIAMALVAGLNGSAAGRRALVVLPVAWIAGGLAGFSHGAEVLPGAVTAVSFLVLGVLAASDRHLSTGTVTGLATALGLLHGWLNGAGIAAAGRESLALVGIGAAVLVVVALAAALVVSLRAGWQRIVVRVAGSWVAAIGLLLLGWEVRRGP
ncbi:MAG: HupE/UreJ family protein [Gemmatimonadales bacterium]